MILRISALADPVDFDALVHLKLKFIFNLVRNLKRAASSKLSNFGGFFTSG